MTYTYKPQGTCSQEIRVELENDIVKSIEVIGGCNGNLKGITTLVQGMKAEDVVQKLAGIRCGAKPTSCPDQISRALSKALLMQK